MIAQASVSDIEHLSKMVYIIGGIIAVLNVISFPMMAALYRAWTSRVDKCVTAEVCTTKHQATVDLLKAHLDPINEKLNRLCNGGFVDSVQKRMAEYEHRLAVVETRTERTKPSRRKGE